MGAAASEPNAADKTKTPHLAGFFFDRLQRCGSTTGRSATGLTNNGGAGNGDDGANPNDGDASDAVPSPNDASPNGACPSHGRAHGPSALPRA